MLPQPNPENSLGGRTQLPVLKDMLVATLGIAATMNEMFMTSLISDATLLSIDSSLSDIFEFMKTNRLEDIQLREEERLNNSGDDGPSPTPANDFDFDFSDIFHSIKSTILASSVVFLGAAITMVSEEFTKIIQGTMAFVTMFGKSIASFLANFAPMFSKLGFLTTGFKVVSGAIGKIFIPLQILLGALDFIDGFMKGYVEGGLLEGIKQGLVSVFDGFFGSIVTIFKNVTTWILSKFGLENLAASFSAGIDKVYEDVKGIFIGIIDIFSGIVTLDPKKILEGLIGTGMSLSSFIGNILTSTVNNIVNFFNDLLGFGVPGKPFDINDMAIDSANKVKDWIIGLFDKLPDMIATFTATWSTYFKGMMRSILESGGSVGRKLANEMFGPATKTDGDARTELEKEALDKVTVETKDKYGQTVRTIGTPEKVTDEQVMTRVQEFRDDNYDVKLSTYAEGLIGVKQIEIMKDQLSETLKNMLFIGQEELRIRLDAAAAAKINSDMGTQSGTGLMPGVVDFNTNKEQIKIDNTEADKRTEILRKSMDELSKKMRFGGGRGASAQPIQVINNNNSQTSGGGGTVILNKTNTAGMASPLKRFGN